MRRVAAAVLLFLCLTVASSRAAVIHVSKSATGANNGTSWANAYTNPQEALSAAVSNDEIWVAAGTYIPGTNRADSFQMKEWVDLYGGFSGTETIRGQRNWMNNVTIFSGDVLDDDVGFSNNGENVFHVVEGADNATIDGFTITGGNADASAGAPGTSGLGAGMYNASCSPVVLNCTFAGNVAWYAGGGIFNGASSTVSNCTFCGNVTMGCWGGGMANSGGAPTILNCTFSGNLSTGTGGSGMGNSYSAPTVLNCIFSGNLTMNIGGGGMGNECSSPTLRNCIFWFNSGSELCNLYYSTSTISHCDIRGGWNGPHIDNDATSANLDGGGNIDADPLFAAETRGTWTASATFSTNVGQSILTDIGATWTPGELAGKFIQPDTNTTLQYVVVSNGTTSLTIRGDFTTNALSGKPYRLWDYHLKSRAGHWETGLGLWTNDAVTSPCIDAGDAASTWTNEPAPNGARINIGAYGNTPEASKSPLEVANWPVTAVGTDSATLNGALLFGGTTNNASITVFWGPTDGGTNQSAWSNSIALGWPAIGPFSTNVYSLQPNTPYYYRCWASNAAAGVAWASETTEFTTIGNHAPVWTSIPVVTAYVGQVYSYVYRASDVDGDDLVYSMTALPVWMENTDIISTIAGDGTAVYGGDGGLATNAGLSLLDGIDVDGAGNVYIADTDNARVRKVGTNGIITTIAGNGVGAFGGDGGPATNANLDHPFSVELNSFGEMFIADTWNHRIRKIDTNGTISTVAGNGLDTHGGGRRVGHQCEFFHSSQRYL